MIKGYVKDKNGNIIYKVEIPNTAMTPKLNSGENFVLENDLEKLIPTFETNRSFVNEMEKLISKKIREIAIQALVDEGQISKKDMEKLKEMI